MVSKEYLDVSCLTIDFGDITKKGGVSHNRGDYHGKNTVIFAIMAFPTSVGINLHLMKNVYI